MIICTKSIGISLLSGGSKTRKLRFDVESEGFRMIDFAEKARIFKEADETLERVLSKSYDSFDQYAEVSKITDLEVAKVVIKRLLDKVN